MRLRKKRPDDRRSFGPTHKDANVLKQVEKVKTATSKSGISSNMYITTACVDLFVFIVIELLLLITSITSARTSHIINTTHNTWEISNAYRKKVRISQYLNTL